jgi:cysteine synthase A
MTVVEFTGGSTGSSLAFVCAIKGYTFRVVSSDAFSEEKLATMAAFGADVIVVPSEGKGIRPALFVQMTEAVLAMAKSDDVYWTQQFLNRDALDGYAALGDELMRQVGTPIDAFCGAVGTGGMLMGVSRAFQAAGQSPHVVALEPASSPFLSQGVTGSHSVEGTGVGSRPPLLNDDLFDEARAIEEEEARDMAVRLAREEGVFVGTSGGLNVAGAIRLAQELGPGKTVATVACDTGLKYLSGDLFRT